MKIRSLAFIALFAAGPLYAATPINQTRPLALDGQVSIENLKGRISVHVWAQPQVRITGSLGAGVEKFTIEGDAHSLKIKVKYPQGRDGSWFGWGKSDVHSEPTTLEVMVPIDASLAVDSVSASIDVQGTRARKLSIDNVSGDILVAASSPGEVSLDNVSGDMTLRMTSAKVNIDNVSGDLNLQGGFTGDLNIDTVSGDVQMTGSRVNQFELSTVSGDAVLQVTPLANATIKTDSVSGGLTLILPRETSAHLHAETFSGSIVSPSGNVVKEDGPGETLDTRLGMGQGQIKLDTFSGDIKVQLQ